VVVASTALAFAGVGLAACGSSGDSKSTSTASAGSASSKPVLAPLNFGNPAPGGDIFAHIAVAKGFFKARGLDVKLTDNLGSNFPNALVSGQVDLGWAALPTGLLVTQQGKPTSIIYGTAGAALGASMYGVPGKVTTIDALKKKGGSCRIASLPPGTLGYGAVAVYLKKLGLNCDIVPETDTGAMVGATKAGRVDAFVIASGNVIAPLAAKQIVTIVDASKPDQLAASFGPDYLAIGYVGLTKTMKAKAPSVVAFLKGIKDAYNWFSTASDADVAAAIKGQDQFTALKQSDLVQTIAVDRKFMYSPDKARIDAPAWQNALTQFQDWKIANFKSTSPAFSYANSVDMTYYDQAMGG
jgi:hypothetical protein